jgi:hypothetical protein
MILLYHGLNRLSILVCLKFSFLSVSLAAFLFGKPFGFHSAAVKGDFFISPFLNGGLDPCCF